MFTATGHYVIATSVQPSTIGTEISVQQRPIEVITWQNKTTPQIHRKALAGITLAIAIDADCPSEAS